MPQTGPVLCVPIGSAGGAAAAGEGGSGQERHGRTAGQASFRREVDIRRVCGGNRGDGRGHNAAGGSEGLEPGEGGQGGEPGRAGGPSDIRRNALLGFRWTAENPNM